MHSIKRKIYAYVGGKLDCTASLAVVKFVVFYQIKFYSPDYHLSYYVLGSLASIEAIDLLI